MAAPAEEAGANIPPIKILHDKYAGQIVMITGAGSGIGLCTARLFASEGATVIIVDINETKAQDAAQSINNTGGRAESYVCDITDEEAVIKLVSDWIGTLGKIDILVNLAGIYPFSPLVDTSTDMYRKIMALNTDASFFLTRAVLPQMQKKGYGRIINTASNTFALKVEGLAAYQVSKAAVIGLTRSSAAEAGPGITVNCVMPGYIETETTWNQWVKEDGSHPLFEAIVPQQCVKRRGRPDDIAHAINYLASPEAQFVTGQILDLGGGSTFH